jgi:hypothetical protein
MKLRPALAAGLVGATMAFASAPADAALTSSEKGLIREYFVSAQSDNAQKVRSLIARTDLTAEESGAALSEAIAPIVFTEPRGVFLRELAFGSASTSARPVVVVAIVKSLIARAESIYQRFVGGLDHEPAAMSELIAIYGWLDGAIANAGKPTSTEHDPTAGIPSATYDECSKILRDHIDQNARWLKGDGSVPAPFGRVRAQAQVALIDMLADGLTRRVEAADRLGLKGARRTILTDYGVLLADPGKIDDAGAERVRQLLIRLPGARADLGLISVGEGPGPVLQARGQVVNVAHTTEPYPFPGESAPAGYDPLTSSIAHDLAVVVAMRALDNRWNQLRLQADRDTSSLSGGAGRVLGRPRAPSVEAIVGAAIHSLIIDAPKTLDVAVARAVDGRPESIALVSDSLGVLAAPVEGDTDPKSNAGGKFELGKPNGWTTLSSLRLAPNGTVVGFKLDGHAWAIDRASPSYVVLSVRKDGQTVATGPAIVKRKPEPTPAPKKAAPPRP